LRPDKPNAKKLLVSNERIWFDNGRSFLQPSLSQYFMALNIVCASDFERSKICEQKKGIFLPVRSFQQECLISKHGLSVLDKLFNDCQVIFIQDADLSPKELNRHRAYIKSSDMVALDLTKNLGLKGHFSYALLHSNDSGIKSLGGHRLW
jgi:hypothetical protein